MPIIVTSFNSNPNVGLYLYATNEYCLAGLDVPMKSIKEIEKALNVPVHRMNIAGTSLVGVFCTGNSSKLLLPSIVLEKELKELDRLKISYEVIKSDLTALGNNILCNDNGSIVNHEFTDPAIKQIGKALNVPVKRGKIAGLDTVGSLGVMNQKACLLHTDAMTAEINAVSSLLAIECETGTVNFGNPFIKSGVVCNKNGLIIGSQSGGPEMQYIAQVLKY
jgi:translation initiation factor 6